MRRYTLTERADLAVFYETEAPHWRTARPGVVDVVTQAAFIEFYRRAPSIGFACEGRPIGGILFDGLRAHIAVLPQHHGHWALLMKPALEWLFGLRPAVLAEVAADNHKCLRFLDRHGFCRLSAGPQQVTYLLAPRGGTRKTAYRPARYAKLGSAVAGACPMTIPEITLDLVLRRPAGVPPDRWTEVLTAACCQRLVPHLRSFSIDAERGRLSIGLPEGEPTEGLALDVDAVAAMVAQLAGPR